MAVFAGEGFPEAVRVFVNLHHGLYYDVPPQGIYFEKLVERAFTMIKKPFTPIEAGGANQPRYDLLVEGRRISLKTETGVGTRPDRITITKLCTTEREPWEAQTLVGRVMEHLSRYDLIIMLRAIWRLPLLRYQLLEIPISLLRHVSTAQFAVVGHRKGRQSLGADALDSTGQKLFHAHFDASDGKCSIRDLAVSACDMLMEWEFNVNA